MLPLKMWIRSTLKICIKAGEPRWIFVRMTLADDFLHSFIQCIRWCLRFFLPHNLRHTVSSLIRAKGYFNRDDELKSVVAKGFDLKIYSDHILDSLQIRCIRDNLSSRNQSLTFTRDLHFLLGRCIGNIQSKAGVNRAKKDFDGNHEWNVFLRVDEL